MKQPLPQSRLETPGQHLHTLSPGAAAAPLPPGAEGLCAPRHERLRGEEKELICRQELAEAQPARRLGKCCARSPSQLVLATSQEPATASDHLSS